MPPKRINHIKADMAPQNPHLKTAEEPTAKPNRRRARNTKKPQSKRSKHLPSLSSETPFRLFDLPREIRDHVYDTIWREKKPFLIRHDIFQFWVQYSIEENTTITIPETQGQATASFWLLANKQLTLEAVEQFQRKALWTYCTLEPLNYRHYVPKFWSLIAPWGAHTIIMPNIELHPHYAISYRGKEDAQMSMTFPDSSMTQINRLQSSLISPKFRQLIFFFEVHYRGNLSEYPCGNRILIDLWKIERFAIPSLQRVLVAVVEDVEVIHGIEPDNTLKSLAEPRLYEAVLRLGKVLVGGKANVYSSIKPGIPPTRWFEFDRA